MHISCIHVTSSVDLKNYNGCLFRKWKHSQNLLETTYNILGGK